MLHVTYVYRLYFPFTKNPFSALDVPLSNQERKKNIDVYIVSISIKILIKLALNSTLSLLFFCRPVININIVVFKQIFRFESTELSDGFFSYFFLSVYLYSYNSLIISNLTQSILLFVKMKDNGSSMWEGGGDTGIRKK